MLASDMQSENRLDQRSRAMQKYDKEKKVVRMMSLGDGGDASLVEVIALALRSAKNFSSFAYYNIEG